MKAIKLWHLVLLGMVVSVIVFAIGIKSLAYQDIVLLVKILDIAIIFCFAMATYYGIKTIAETRSIKRYKVMLEIVEKLEGKQFDRED